jgi:leucyl-tRNA synthetase
MAWRVKDDRPAKLRPAVRYRLHDLAVSRQNAWGAPIPLIHCDACGTVPVPVADLPVRLPQDLRISESDSTLTKHPDFVSAQCPSCGGQACRETDTLDCHFNRLWQWIAFAAPHADRSSSPFEHPELDRWLAVNRAVLSADHGRDLFDQRTTAKALRDRGLLASLPTGEPYVGLTAHETVHIGGQDMSQRPPDFDELVSQAGADAVRLAVLYAAAPTNALTWSDNALTYCGRWLRKLWEYALPRLSWLDELGLQPQIAQTDRTRMQLARWCDTAFTRITENLESLHMHKAVLNVMRLLERIEVFEQRALAGADSPSTEDQAAAAAALLLLLRLLNPLAPHISEELWARAGQRGPLANHAWPEHGRSDRQAGQRGAS